MQNELCISHPTLREQHSCKNTILQTYTCMLFIQCIATYNIHVCKYSLYADVCMQRQCVLFCLCLYIHVKGAFYVVQVQVYRPCNYFLTTY